MWKQGRSFSSLLEPEHRKRRIKPKAVELELHLRRVKVAAEPGQLISRTEQATHLVEHQRIQGEKTVAVAAQFLFRHRAK